MALSVPIRCPEHPCRSPIVASSRLDMQPLRVCEGGINTLAVGQWRRLCVGNVCQFDHYLDGKKCSPVDSEIWIQDVWAYALAVIHRL
jgi:hypothetical protein